LDNTFRVSGKATIIDNQKTRVKLLKGGVLSFLNEEGDIVAWVRDEPP
jgi:hypothetical protein